MLHTDSPTTRLQLVPLTILIPDHREKLAKYREEMVVYYSKELLRFGEFKSSKKALKASYLQVNQNLPENLITQQGHYFFDLCLISKNKTIGYLWYECYPGNTEACLMYIYIFPDQRRHGLGRETMKLYEKLLFNRNIKDSSLFVFINNTPAVNLYISTGYHIDKRIKMFEGKSFTRYRMSKYLL